MNFQVLINGIDKTSLVLRNTLKISRQRDCKNSCGFTIKSTASYIPRNGESLEIYADEVLKFGGVITNNDVEEINQTDIEIAIESTGFHHIPKRRTISSTFDTTHAGNVVTAMVDVYLSAEGITKGTISAGAEVDEYDIVCKDVLSVLDEMADMSGFVWWIDDYMQLYFMEEPPLVNSSHSLIQNGAFKNFRRVKLSQSLEDYANKIWVRSSNIEDEVYDPDADGVVVVEDTSSQTAQANIEGGTGVYGLIIDDANIKTSTDARNLGLKLLNKHKIQPKVLSFESTEMNFDANQKVNVSLPRIGLGNSYFVIDSIEIFDDGSEELNSTIKMLQLTADNKAITQNNGVEYFKKLVKKANNAPKNAKEAKAIPLTFIDEHNVFTPLKNL